MGGGHHEPFKVPDYKIYNNYQTVPELVQHERRLAQMGLKDPWIRNKVWMFDGKNLHGWKLVQKSVFAGFGVGIGYAVVLIGCTELYGRMKSKKGHGDGHHKEHHGGEHSAEHHGH